VEIWLDTARSHETIVPFLVTDCWNNISFLLLTGLREFCHSETFSAECAEDEVIVIRSALYGRMRTGRCLSHDSGIHPCWQNVIRQADRLCSGRRKCEIRVPEPTFDATKPCQGGLRVYLELISECVQGKMPRLGLQHNDFVSLDFE
jgi:Galactose binding lectin domain